MVIYAPDFYIVGAPKAATTTLYHVLAAHPQIYMSKVKEPQFFCTDLESPYAIRESAAYAALFDGALRGERTGEASVQYLRSKVAPAAIRHARPDARIIIMLRDPVALIDAYHREQVFNGNEDRENLLDALDVEAARIRGAMIPPACSAPERLLYTRVFELSTQVQRYLDTFGRDQVLILCAEDLQADGMGTYQRLCRFVGVAEGHVPDLTPRNRHKEPRSKRVRNLRSPNSRFFRIIAPTVLRSPALRRLASWVNALNTRPAERPAMDPAVRAALQGRMRPEVTALAKVVGRDLETLWGYRSATASTGSLDAAEESE